MRRSSATTSTGCRPDGGGPLSGRGHSGQPGWETLREVLLNAEHCLMSAATLVESGMVMEGRLGREGALDLDRLIVETAIEIVAFDLEQAQIARTAFQRFGKGVHPAGLNFGDCMTYALAKHLDEPVLFVGEEFPRTDVRSARP